MNLLSLSNLSPREIISNVVSPNNSKTKGFTFGMKLQAQQQIVPGVCSYDILNDKILSSNVQSPRAFINQAKRTKTNNLIHSGNTNTAGVGKYNNNKSKFERNSLTHKAQKFGNKLAIVTFQTPDAYECSLKISKSCRSISNENKLRNGIQMKQIQI